MINIEQNIQRIERELAQLKEVQAQRKQAQPRFHLEGRAVGSRTVNYTVYDRENPNVMHARFFCPEGTTTAVFERASAYVKMLNTQPAGEQEPAPAFRYHVRWSPMFFAVYDHSRPGFRVAKFYYAGGRDSRAAADAERDANEYALNLNRRSN